MGRHPSVCVFATFDELVEVAEVPAELLSPAKALQCALIQVGAQDFHHFFLEKKQETPQSVSH